MHASFSYSENLHDNCIHLDISSLYSHIDKIIISFPSPTLYDDMMVFSRELHNDYDGTTNA